MMMQGCIQRLLAIGLVLAVVVATPERKWFPPVEDPSVHQRLKVLDNFTMILVTLAASLWGVAQAFLGGSAISKAQDEVDAREDVSMPITAVTKDVCVASPIPHVEMIDMMSGARLTTNPTAPQAFDNPLASGRFAFLHRPLDESLAEAASDAKARYFSGKKRLWEIRFQCTFKQAVKASACG